MKRAFAWKIVVAVVLLGVLALIGAEQRMGNFNSGLWLTPGWVLLIPLGLGALLFYRYRQSKQPGSKTAPPSGHEVNA